MESQMAIHIELRDTVRKIRVHWFYNSAQADITSLLDNRSIGTLGVLMKANPSPREFRTYVDACIDQVLEGYAKAAAANG